MGKMIEIEWPEIQVSVRASLLEEEEPELCEILWENLENPLKLFSVIPSRRGRSSAGSPDHRGTLSSLALRPALVRLSGGDKSKFPNPSLVGNLARGPSS